jgi:hypothetical protein
VVSDLETLEKLPPAFRGRYLADLDEDRKQKVLAELQARKLAVKFRDDPVGYITDPLDETIWSKQREICEAVRDNPRVAVPACHAPGKMAGVNEPVLTPTGWVRHGDLSKGDTVYAMDGSPVTVISVSPQGRKPLYRVHFNDGSHLDVGLEHMWVVHRHYHGDEKQKCVVCDERYLRVRGASPFCESHRWADKWGGKHCSTCLSYLPVRAFSVQSDRKDGRRAMCRDCHKDRRRNPMLDSTKRAYWEVVTTRDIIEYGGFNPVGHRRAEIPLTEPVLFPQRDVPMDPYALGVMLGDGDCRGGVLTSADAEIVESLGAFYDVVPMKSRYQYRVRGVRPDLQTAGVFGLRSWNKHVPEDYRFNEPGPRLAMLQGLLDTDGTCDKRDGHVEFTSVSKQLAEDVVFLVQSLGGTARLTTKTKTSYQYKGEHRLGRTAYRVHIRLAMCPFRLRRKALLWASAEERRQTGLKRLVQRIERVDDDEAVCVVVDHPSHTYLSRGFVVSHNSHLAARIIAWWIQSHPLGTAQAVTTATTFRQVRNILWPHIRRLHDRHELPGRCNLTEWWIGDELVAYGFSAVDTDPESVQGIHAPHLLILVDEAAGISHALGQAFESLMSGDDVHMLLLGNPPTDREGTWFEQCCESPLFHTIELSAEQTPNWTGEETDVCKACPTSEEEHLVAKHLIPKKFAEDIATEWGEDSPMYLAKVLARFPRGVASKVIPLSWIAAALGNTKPWTGTEVALGCDIASDGGDEVVVARRVGHTIDIVYMNAGETNANAVDVAGALLVHILDAERLNEDLGNPESVRVKVDAVGVGWGVFGFLERWGQEGKHHSVIVPVLAGNKAADPDKYLNQRAEMWWTGRLAFALTRTEDGEDQVKYRLKMEKKSGAQLSSPNYRTETTGKIRIERKREMRSRGVPSPDRAEAVLMTIYEPPIEEKKKKARLIL